MNARYFYELYGQILGVDRNEAIWHGLLASGILIIVAVVYVLYEQLINKGGIQQNGSE